MLTEAEIKQFIQEDTSSSKKRHAKVGDRYYNAEHDILQYRMFYFNADGNLVEDKTRSNIKIPHPFFTELVDQETQYILSGKDGYVKTDKPDLQKRLDEYFNDSFTSELSDTIAGAVSKGFDYMYAYMNRDERLAFQHADCMGVVEVRAKDTDDGCEYVIFWYVDRVAKRNKTIKRVQVWDSQQTTFYVQEEDGKLIKDTKEPINPRPHITYKKDGEDAIYYDGFGFIPFFRLDNNRKQESALSPIKSLIDDYDMMSCGLSNNLADFDHPLHVVKGFQGDDLSELAQNLKTKKIVGVDENGGVEVHTVDVPYQARIEKMKEDEKNIYRFGMGFNSAAMGDGNITNIVIKSRYALLDLKCNKLEVKLKDFLSKILKVVLAEINRIDGTDYQMSDVWFEFNREVMTNAQDNAQIELIDVQKQGQMLDNILKVANVLDDDTVLKHICETLELDYEEIKEQIDINDASKNLDNDMSVLDGVVTDE